MEKRICKAVRKVPVRCKNQKTFRVCVQPSNRVNFLQRIFFCIVKIFLRNKAVDRFVKPIVFCGADGSRLFVHHKIYIRCKIFFDSVYGKFIRCQVQPESAFKNSCAVYAYIVLLQKPAHSSVCADSTPDKNRVQPFLKKSVHLQKYICAFLKNQLCFL